MHQTVLFSVLSAFVAKSLAQAAIPDIAFVNMTWNAVQVGQEWPINWSIGNGEAVTLAFGNSTWNEIIASAIPATPGTYDWTIVVPAGFVPGDYELSLSQVNEGTKYSPLFGVAFGDVIPPPANVTSGTSMLAMPTITSSTSSTSSMSMNGTMTISPVMPTVTVVWWDPACTCHQTSTSICTTATGGAMPALASTFYDTECGCTKTALAPAVASVAPTGANNYTAPMVSPAMPTAPAASSAAPVSPAAATPVAPAASQYTGAADAVKIGGSVLGVVALVAAVLL